MSAKATPQKKRATRRNPVARALRALAQRVIENKKKRPARKGAKWVKVPDET